jgi:hypothetical protein
MNIRRRSSLAIVCGYRTMRRLLTDALDLWWTAKGQTRRAARAIIAG